MPHFILIAGLPGRLMGQLSISSAQRSDAMTSAISHFNGSACNGHGIKGAELVPDKIGRNADANRERSELAKVVRQWDGQSINWYADPRLNWTIGDLSETLSSTSVLLYESPVAALASMRLLGPEAPIDITKAMDIWQRYNSQLLAVYRARPKNSLLVRADQLMAKGSDLVCDIESVAHHQLPSDLEALLLDMTDDDARPANQEAIADAMVAQGFPEVHELFLELESCATLLGRNLQFNTTEPNPVEQAQAFLQLQLQSYGARDNAETQAVTAQQAKALKEVNGRLESTLQESSRKMVTLESSLQEKIRKIEDLEAEGELMLLQLNQVQVELEHYFLKYERANELVNAFCVVQQQTRRVVSSLLHLPAMSSLTALNELQ